MLPLSPSNQGNISAGIVIKFLENLLGREEEWCVLIRDGGRKSWWLIASIPIGYIVQFGSIMVGF